MTPAARCVMLSTLLAAGAWSTPADACSKRAPHVLMPATEDERQVPYPSNTHLLAWGASQDLRLVDAQKHTVAAVRRGADAYVQVEPTTSLVPGTYAMSDRYRGDYEFAVDGPADLTAPKLVRATGPVRRFFPAGRCPAELDTTFKVVVEDDSPVVVVVWGGTKQAPDLAAEPVWAARIVAGALTIDENVYPGDLVPSAARRWALMAVDAAGNTSDVVLLPGGARVDAMPFAGPETQLAPEPLPAPVVPTPTTTRNAPPSAPPAQAAPHGCGCDLPGTAAAPYGWPLLGLLVCWRRRRPG